MGGGGVIINSLTMAYIAKSRDSKELRVSSLEQAFQG